MIWDEERLRALLDVPELAWLRARLRDRLERGAALPRIVVHRTPTAAEREAIERIFGRAPVREGTLRVAPAKLLEVLRAARIADDLAEALARIDGPLRDRVAEGIAKEREWAELDARARARIDARAWLAGWYETARDAGLLARLGTAERAWTLLEHAFEVIDRLPERGLSLPELAADVAGDAHALDEGRELGMLVVRAAAAYAGLPDWQSGEGRRECWAAVGVLCDELSAPVLTLGLGASGHGLTDRVLAMHHEAGEACSLSLRELVRHAPRFEHLGGATVFVCENPAVVASAVDRLGARSAPLVCTSGYLRAAARVLLRALVLAGAELRVQADFDIDGVHIAAKSLALQGARPWRFDAATYRSARPGPPLRRDEVPPTPWDPELAEAMAERAKAAHEESILPLLLDDLALHARSS